MKDDAVKLCEAWEAEEDVDDVGGKFCTPSPVISQHSV